MFLKLSLLAFLAVPVLLALAYREWAARIRRELPPWRNGLCLGALLLLVINWAGDAVSGIAFLTRSQLPNLQLLNESTLTVSHWLSALVILLSLAFRRSSRIQAVVAGLLMLIFWPLG